MEETLPEQAKSKDLTESPVFIPTPAMVVWLDMAIQTMSDSPQEIENACKEANTPVTRQSWYLWAKDEAFRQWYRQEWDKRLAMVGPALDAIGLKQAKRDHKYWQDMQRRVGNFTENKNGNVAVQVNNFIKKEKDEFGI